MAVEIDDKHKIYNIHYILELKIYGHFQTWQDDKNKCDKLFLQQFKVNKEKEQG